MLNSKLIHVFIPFVFLIAGCKQSHKANLPNSEGSPGNLIIISDNHTQNDLNKSLDEIFLKSTSDSIETDAFFEILKPGIADFSELFYNQKTILVLVTADNYNEMKDLLVPFSDDNIHQLINDPNSKFQSITDLFAKPQHLVYLFGKNSTDLRNKLMTNRTEIVSTLLNFELSDQRKSLYADTSKNGEYYSLLKEKYGVGIQIPAAFKLNQKSANFYWFQMETKENETTKIRGLIIHAYPYKDSTEFSYISIRSNRDTICKHHIFGEIKGTYMGTTESDFYPNRSREMILINGYTACKINGWWTIKGLSMAGPFVRYVVHVPEKKLIFAFEGYIYSADLNKRERDLRLFEAMALSIK